MSFAPMVSSTRSRLRSARWRRAVARIVLQFGDSAARAVPGAGRAGAGARTLARALAVEKAGVDGGARAAERNEGDGEMAVLDRKRERGAHLVAVERAVTGAAHPARTLPRPIAHAHVLAGRDVAGLVAAEAGPSGPVILAAVEAPEAEAVVGQPHGAVGIALAGGDRVLPCRRSSTSRTWISLTRRCAVPSGKTMSTLAVVGRPWRRRAFTSSLQAPFTWRAAPSPSSKRPDATVVGRQSPGEDDADAVIARRKVDFALAVAIAEFQELAGPVDAQPLDQCRAPSRGRRSRAPAAARPRARHRRAPRRRGAGNRPRCGTGGTGS